jgi:hypothetical protein
MAVVRIISFLSFQGSRNEGQGGAPAEVLVLRTGGGDLSRHLAQLRLIQLDDAAEADVVASVSEAQRLPGLFDQARRHVQTSEGVVGFEPCDAYLFGNLNGEGLHIAVGCLGAQFGFGLAGAVELTVETLKPAAL